MTGPDDEHPDTAMYTGADAGEPGEHLARGDLTPDEMRLLAELKRNGPGSDDEEAEAEAMAQAAEDEAPLPGQGGDQGDGLSARFAAPPEN
ncbi:hypothetical protein [Geodermatophilus ruber]|uniref:Uncharacterized protein n=1 Tax=Geodermatophilus ruber TaxID=504800 RepID=A0A1I4DZP5_9ACTN|nr:hypothetical protein [Geodermatophilus ruber]SFK97576.1 hypothetical protein SAMN04488085_10574 [Geodermatophilus ruber]